MAKFCGKIGYGEPIEVKPGVWEDKITEYTFYGELNRNNRRLQSSSQLNDNINISNEISILADPELCQNFHLMKYVEFMGTKWKISNIEVQYPRLILTTGGVYNGQ